MPTRLVSKDRPSFKQQNLPAWQPILTAGTVLPTFFLIGVAFVPIGIGLLMSSTKVQEIELDYTDCLDYQHRQCSSIVPQSACKCERTFVLNEDFRSEIYAYYGLSNFYQNHRRYVKSRDDVQLLGNPKSVASECFPFDYAIDPIDKVRKPIAPCGAIANSKFNDTFELRRNDPDGPINFRFHRKGIAWPSDKRIRFQNPPGDLAAAFAGTIKPPNWRKPVYELAPSDAENNGFQNEDLIVWMRTAALPTFRKLWGIVGSTADQNKLEYLPRGNYSLIIDYNYPVTMFNGRKRFILSNTTWLGGKNPFLGIAYVVVGSVCFVLSALFLYVHKRYGKLPSEITQINQTTPYLSS